MDYKTAYDKSIGLYNSNTNLLFQRLNFFLVATAFLLAAFATILTVGRHSNLLNFDYILSFAGFIYSILSASTNYINTKVILEIGKYIRALESHDFQNIMSSTEQTPYVKIDQIAEKFMYKERLIGLIPGMCKSVFTLIFKKRTAENKNIADHTYIVPLLFTLVWGVLFTFLFFWR